MKNTFSVLFYVKKQQKKSGLLPIMGRITVNKQTTQFFTQLEIDPQTTEWDSKTKKINGKGASSLNSQLRNIEARIRTTYQEMSLCHRPSPIPGCRSSPAICSACLASWRNAMNSPMAVTMCWTPTCWNKP